MRRSLSKNSANQQQNRKRILSYSNNKRNLAGSGQQRKDELVRSYVGASASKEPFQPPKLSQPIAANQIHMRRKVNNFITETNSPARPEYESKFPSKTARLIPPQRTL